MCRIMSRAVWCINASSLCVICFADDLESSLEPIYDGYKAGPWDQYDFLVFHNVALRVCCLFSPCVLCLYPYALHWGTAVHAEVSEPLLIQSTSCFASERCLHASAAVPLQCFKQAGPHCVWHEA